MTKIMSVSQAKKDMNNLVEELAQTHEPILIRGKNNNVVMISQDDWKSIEETIYLNSIPNMATSIQEAMNSSDSEFSESIEW